MSKDEYLITDAPLKALDGLCNADDSRQLFFSKYTIWLIPLSSVSLGLLRTCSCRCMCSADQCFHLCGTGCRCGCRCAREPLFRCQRVWKNENHRVNVFV